MNKTDVVNKVADLSGVPAETCEKVIDSLEKVLQEELGSKGGMAALGKIGSLLQFFGSGK